MGWFELRVEVPPEWSDAVANFLFESGTPGLQCEEDADRTVLVAYFTAAPPIESLRHFCANVGGALLCSSVGISVRRVADEDWASSWKSHFPPQLIGDRLYVCPPWASSAPPGRAAVVINPGMAFGTGQHATTRGCLLLMERSVSKRPVMRALDVGTGSGVLAIALAKLGVPEVCAVENDASARTIAAANFTHNSVHGHIQMTAYLDDISGTFDLITANLFANLLDEMAPRLTQSLRRGGTLICSGLLICDEDRVRAAYARHGIVLTRGFEEDGWVTLSSDPQGQP